MAVTPTVSTWTVASTNNTQLTLTKPAGVVSGNLLLLIVANDAANVTDWSTLTGWTRFVNINNTISDANLACYWRVADGSEGANVTVTGSSSIDRVGYYIRVSGSHGSTPVYVIGTPQYSGANSTFTINQVTATTANSLGFYAIAFDGGDGLPFATSGTGWSEKASTNTGGLSYHASIAWGVKDISSSGASVPVNFTASVSDGATFVQFAIAPSASIAVAPNDVVCASTVSNPTAQRITDVDAISDVIVASTVESAPVTRTRLVTPNDVTVASNVTNSTIWTPDYFVDTADDEWVDTEDDDWFETAATIDVAVNTIRSATSVDSPTVTIDRLVTPNDVVSVTSVANPTITTAWLITPNDVISASTVTAPTAQRVVTVTPSAVTSATSVSSPTIPFRLRLITPSVVTSATSVGTVTVGRRIDVSPNDVTSAASVSSPAITYYLLSDRFQFTDDDDFVSTADDYWYPEEGNPNVYPDNVVSGTSVASPSIGRTRLITPNDVVSTPTADGPTIGVTGRIDVNPNNVTSATSVSSPTATGVTAFRFEDDATFQWVDDAAFVWEPFVQIEVYPDAVSVATSVTAPAVERRRLITPNDVVSAGSSVSNPAVVNVGGVPVSVEDIVGATAVGSPTIQRVVTVTPSAVTSATSVSSPTAQRVVTVTPSAISAATAVGTPTVQCVVDVSPSNVISTTSVSAPALGRRRLITPTAVSAETDITNPTIGTYSIVTVTPNDVTSATRVRNVRVYPYGVAQRRGELLLLKAA